MSDKPNHGETNPNKNGPSENNLANTDAPEAQNADAEGNTSPTAEPTLNTPETPKQEASTASSSPSETDETCLLYTSPSPRDKRQSRMPSSA